LLGVVLLLAAGLARAFSWLLNGAPSPMIIGITLADTSKSPPSWRSSGSAACSRQ
jgi:hypothetical protein